jgi:hypothetical protein
MQWWGRSSAIENAAKRTPGWTYEPLDFADPRERQTMSLVTDGLMSKRVTGGVVRDLPQPGFATLRRTGGLGVGTSPKRLVRRPKTRQRGRES